MKKIMGLAISATLLIALVVGGTWAYFQDTEATKNNTFTAGTLDLTLGGSSNVETALFTVSNVAPGDADAATAALENIGSIAGDLSVTIGSITNTESTGDTEYEKDNIGGAGNGELGANLDVALYFDLDGGGWGQGDIGLKIDSGSYITYENTDGNVDLVYIKADDLASANWAGVYALAASGTVNLVIDWKVDYGTSVNNDFQGDSVEFDVTFVLKQVAPTP
jgi:spore coat-associated protein N